ELAAKQPESRASDVREMLINRSRAYGSIGRLSDAGVDYCRAEGLPVRDPRAPPSAIDLSLFYGAPLTESLHDWKGFRGKDLAKVPVGLQTFEGVLFDVRGIAQLSGAVDSPATNSQARFPEAITNVSVKLKFRKLHALIGTGWQQEIGVQIATII